MFSFLKSINSNTSDVPSEVPSEVNNNNIEEQNNVTVEETKENVQPKKDPFDDENEINYMEKLDNDEIVTVKVDFDPVEEIYECKEWSDNDSEDNDDKEDDEERERVRKNIAAVLKELESKVNILEKSGQEVDKMMNQLNRENIKNEYDYAEAVEDYKNNVMDSDVVLRPLEIVEKTNWDELSAGNEWNNFTGWNRTNYYDDWNIEYKSIESPKSEIESNENNDKYEIIMNGRELNEKCIEKNNLILRRCAENIYEYLMYEEVSNILLYMNENIESSYKFKIERLVRLGLRCELDHIDFNPKSKDCKKILKKYKNGKEDDDYKNMKQLLCDFYNEYLYDILDRINSHLNDIEYKIVNVDGRRLSRARYVKTVLFTTFE